MRKTLIRVLPLLFLEAALLTACYNPFFDSILGRRRGRNREDAGDGAQPLAALGVVTDLAAVRDSPVTFTWTDPEGDFEYIEIWYGYSADDKTGTSLTPIRVPKGTQTCTIPDPLPGAELYFHFTTVDANGKRSAVVNYLVPVKVPVQVTNLTGKVTGGDSVTLTWTNPANSAFDHIEITINPGGTTRKVKKGEGEQSYTWAGLSSGTEYTFTVKTFDKDGNITVTEVKVRLEEDKTPPGPVTNLAAVDGGFGSVELNWKNPSDADLQYVEITCEPSSGKARTVNAAPLANGTYTWAGLAGGLTYTFTLKAVDHSGNRSAEASASGTPLDLTPPAAVTNLKAAPGDGYVVLTWTDPGDADLDYIQIECNEIAGPAKIVSKGVQGYTWDTGEYWYEPFTNYTAYTFTVATRDLTGNLGPAATVGPVIPPGTLAQRIAAAASGDTIYLYADEAIPAAIGIGKTIILIGDSAERTLSIDGYSGSMFNVTAGGSLTLDDKVTLKGKSGNNAAVVNVNGGSFVIKDGSQISGNNAATGGGVYVASGTFTMEGGTISGNNAVAGGGVYVGGGTFSMTGGEIKANKATNVPSGWGGGVAITNTGNAAFSKTGGTIYGNNGNENRNKAGNVGQAVRVYSTVSRDTTAGPEINLFYNGTTASGDW